LQRLLSEYFYICRVVNLNKLINNHTNGINVVINTVNYEKIICFTDNRRYNDIRREHHCICTGCYSNNRVERIDAE